MWDPRGIGQVQFILFACSKKDCHRSEKLLPKQLSSSFHLQANKFKKDVYTFLLSNLSSDAVV